MKPQVTDPLAQLRDIHPPEPVSWWPPAPGWWALALLLLALLAWSIWRWRRRQRWRAPLRQAQQELDQAFSDWQANQQTSVFLYAVSSLLRRSLLLREPVEQVAALHGPAWLLHLDAVLGGHEFSHGPGQVLVNGLYQRGVDVDAPALHELARKTLQRLAVRGRRP